MVDTSFPNGQVSTKSGQVQVPLAPQARLVLDALDMAVGQRRPASVIHHSDQGCQYTSFAFGERCRQWGVAPSMGSVGDCYDNAMAESFFATLECELLDRTRFQDHRQAQREIFEYIEGWYNPCLLYTSPSPRDRQKSRMPSSA